MHLLLIVFSKSRTKWPSNVYINHHNGDCKQTSATFVDTPFVRSYWDYTSIQKMAYAAHLACQHPMLWTNITAPASQTGPWWQNIQIFLWILCAGLFFLCVRLFLKKKRKPMHEVDIQIFGVSHRCFSYFCHVSRKPLTVQLITHLSWIPLE